MRMIDLKARTESKDLLLPFTPQAIEDADLILEDSHYP
jgi:hypothetical protein